MSTQIKKFRLLDDSFETEVNVWLTKNYNKIEMSPDSKGPSIRVLGTTDPIMMIQYDPGEKFSSEYYREGIAEEIQLRKAKFFQSVQQLEDARERLKIVPQYDKQKGNRGLQETKLYTEIKSTLEMTKRDMLLQKASIKSLIRLRDTAENIPSCIVSDEEGTLSPEEKKEAAQKL